MIYRTDLKGHSSIITHKLFDGKYLYQRKVFGFLSCQAKNFVNKALILLIILVDVAFFGGTMLHLLDGKAMVRRGRPSGGEVSRKVFDDKMFFLVFGY